MRKNDCTSYSYALRLERVNVPHTRTDLTVASRESGNTPTRVAVDAVHTGAAILTKKTARAVVDV